MFTIMKVTVQCTLQLELVHIVTDWAVSRKRISKHVPKRSRIGAHCCATVRVLWFTARSVTLTVESRYPRQRILKTTATSCRLHTNDFKKRNTQSDTLRGGVCYHGRLTVIMRNEPCEGGVEYLHRSLANRRRRRKGKSRIWDSKIWSRVPRDSDHRTTVLSRTSNNCKRQTRRLVRESAPHQQNRNCLTVIKIWP
jgi:hypothetical protein